MTDPIHITDAAAMKSWELVQAKDGNSKIRVTIQGGGCQGFRYDFLFSDSIQPGDIVITKCIDPIFQSLNNSNNSRHTVFLKKHKRKIGLNQQVEWLVDAVSFQFLHGVEIDYVEKLQGGERFVLRNLKAKTTCSCGSSFEPDAYPE